MKHKLKQKKKNIKFIGEFSRKILAKAQCKITYDLMTMRRDDSELQEAAFSSLL